MIIEVLNDLEANGTLKVLVRNGVIPAKIVFYREVYMQVEAYIIINQCNIGLAVSEVAEKLNIHERTVHRAIKTMKSL
jgi:hypothetical protein